MILAALACTRLGSRGWAVAGWMGVAFFGSVLPLILRMAARRGPMLVTDARGVDFRELPIGVVPWDDVVDLRVGKLSHSVSYASNCGTKRPTFPAWASSIAPARGRVGRWGFPLVSIGFAATDKTLEDAMRAAQAFLAAKAAAGSSSLAAGVTRE